MRMFPCLPFSPLSALDGLSLDKIQVSFSVAQSMSLKQARDLITEPDANSFFLLLLLTCPRMKNTVHQLILSAC